MFSGIWSVITTVFLEVNMFESFSYKKVSKEVIREYKDGKLVRERTIINDGGTSQEEAEQRLDKANERMSKMFEDMDNLFKDLF